MPTYYRPRQVSERESAHRWPDGQLDDSHWEDCGPTSVVMLANAISGGRHPASLAEAEALRKAAGYGPLGGTNLTRLLSAARARYRIAATYVAGADAIWRALAPGSCAALAGSYAVFPAGHRLRRHDPHFAGAHSVYVQRDDLADRVWWQDPLAPASYGGEWVARADLLAFLRGLGGGAALVGRTAGVPDPAPIPSAAAAPSFVRVGIWPGPRSTLSKIATASGVTLAQLLAFPENASFRANPGRVLPGQRVRVK